MHLRNELDVNNVPRCVVSAKERCPNEYGCSYQCAILEGKYTCLCPAGQRLAEDGKLCEGE